MLRLARLSGWIVFLAGLLLQLVWIDELGLHWTHRAGLTCGIDWLD